MKNLLVGFFVVSLAVAASATDWRSQSLLSAALVVNTNTTYAYSDYVPATNSYGLVTNVNRFQDVKVTSYVNGEPNANLNITVAVAAGNTFTTNDCSVTIAKIGDGVNAATDAGSQFVFRFKATGASAFVVSTNLPTALVTGANGLRVVSLVTLAGVGGQTNLNTISSMTVNGTTQ